jgi:5-methylcytosine-specific restriction enzyme subunit McrC
MTKDKNILIRNIYHMLAYAFQELRQNNYESIAGEKFENIHQLLAEILIRGVSYQLKQGLHREYVQVSETLMTVKGRIDIPGTMAERIQHRTGIACEHDEFSEDCLFNRIIKSTMALLLRTDGLKAEQRGALKRLMPYFDGVATMEISQIRWSTLRFDRNTRTYQMLLYICNFIIDGLLPTTEAGRYRMTEFSDDRMCRLYEKFILEYYRKEHPWTKAEAKQIGWNVDKEKSSMDILPILQTDVFLTLKERCLIIDAKYYSHTMQRHFDKNTIHSANLNQICVYVYNEDGERGMRGTVDGMLLYAKTDESVTPDDQIRMKTGSTIWFRTLDLGVEFAQIREQLDGYIKLYTSDR